MNGKVQKENHEIGADLRHGLGHESRKALEKEELPPQTSRGRKMTRP